MTRVLLASTLAVYPAGTTRAQSVMCRDNTVPSGAHASRMCVAHSGFRPHHGGASKWR